MFKCSVVSTQEEIDAGKGLWELTLRSFETATDAKGKKYSWGIPATNERVASHFTVRALFPETGWMGLTDEANRPLHPRFARRLTKYQRGLGRSSQRSPGLDCKALLPTGTLCSLGTHPILY